VPAGFSTRKGMTSLASGPPPGDVNKVSNFTPSPFDPSSMPGMEGGGTLDERGGMKAADGFD
jgi:hypothetical protein